MLLQWQGTATVGSASQGYWNQGGTTMRYITATLVTLACLAVPFPLTYWVLAPAIF